MEELEKQKETADKYSLRERVFHQMRENILEGKYQPKEELKESAIAAELKISRTPVREALHQLELEGLVTIIPNKGAYVTGISEKDIHDIYIIRSYLEGLCARWACENMTEERLDELEEVIYLSEFHTRKGHHEQVVELDNKFHELIYEGSGSKILHHVLSDFHHYVQRVRKLSLSRTERAEESNKEHLAILEALRKGDSKLAEELAHTHIRSTIQDMEDIKAREIERVE